MVKRGLIDMGKTTEVPGTDRKGCDAGRAKSEECCEIIVDDLERRPVKGSELQCTTTP
jgi:hypothetical protein